MRFFVLMVMVLGIFGTDAVRACGVSPLERQAMLAVRDDAGKAQEALKKLREAGPDGLEAMQEIFFGEIEEHRAGRGELNSRWDRIRTAMDAVAQQRDAWASGLYWYTDLDKAQAMAKARGLPILSLRMLGNLSEEYSCANSRFFRTTLYSNAEVSEFLRQHYILHWQSVRPVPVITVDMGDGRKLRRTITGNSIHYILAADGRVVDALPGLYGPAAFLRGLKGAESIAKIAMDPKADLNVLLPTYHTQSAETLALQWTADLNKAGVATVSAAGDPALKDVAAGAYGAKRLAAGPNGAAPPAMRAMRAAVGKSMVERPLLMAAFPADVLEKVTDDAVWERIGALHAADSRLDAVSKALIQSKNPQTAEAALASVTHYGAESTVADAMRGFEKSAAVDTVKNEYRFHLKIHQWLAGEFKAMPLNELNEKVYAELFLTPSSDPWLGLAPAGVFTALDGEGISK